jgi:hypothetical protein
VGQPDVDGRLAAFRQLCGPVKLHVVVTMTRAELDGMYPGVPHDRFIAHDWRKGLVRLGEIEGEFVREISNGAVDYSVASEIARPRTMAMGPGRTDCSMSRTWGTNPLR